MPAPYTSEQRQASQAERDARRGYAADPTLQHSVLKMECGKPSQSLAALMSYGVAPDAFDELAALHFQPDPADPLALTAEEAANYDRLVASTTQRTWRQSGTVARL